MPEEWRDIPGYEGAYQVSSLGRVKSMSRVVNGRCHHTGAPFTRTIHGRVLKPGRYCKSGHVSVVLGHGANGRPVHELVMLAFVGPRPLGSDICHNNGDPTDNRLDNLRYDNRTENILDVYRSGKRWRKLSADDVVAVRRLLRQGVRGSAIAKKYGVSQSCISAIKTGRAYWWLKDEDAVL